MSLKLAGEEAPHEDDPGDAEAANLPAWSVAARRAAAASHPFFGLDERVGCGRGRLRVGGGGAAAARADGGERDALIGLGRAHGCAHADPARSHSNARKGGGAAAAVGRVEALRGGGGCSACADRAGAAQQEIRQVILLDKLSVSEVMRMWHDIIYYLFIKIPVNEFFYANFNWCFWFKVTHIN